MFLDVFQISPKNPIKSKISEFSKIYIERKTGFFSNFFRNIRNLKTIENFSEISKKKLPKLPTK